MGDQVRAGAPLADLDATTLDLAVETAQANLQAAEAQYANAAGSEGRLRALTESDVTTVANLQQAEQQSAAALANVVQARSRLAQATEQLSYASLVAPFDGVVTTVGAEPGAVVAAGQSVLTVARTDARDVVIDVPESFVQNLEVGTAFRVAPQLSPATMVDGKLREIAPEADPVTRSWRLKIGIDDPLDAWAANLDDNVTPVEQRRRMRLSDRTRRKRFGVEVTKTRFDWAADRLLDQRLHGREWKRRNAVLQF